MTKAEFIEAILDSEAKEYIDKFNKPKVMDYYEYLYNEYNDKVERYLPLIAEWRASDDRPNEQIIKNVLGVSGRTWDVLKKIPFFRGYLDLGGFAMKFKSQKDLIDAIHYSVQDGKYIAKLYEMQLTRFDEGYAKKKNGEEKDVLPSKLKIEFVNGSLSDNEIKEKSGKTFDVEGE